MAKRAGILSGHYKTDAEVYLTAADLLDLDVNDVMMAAAHERDLDASQDVGLHSWELLGEQYPYRRPHRTAPDSRGRGLDIPHSNSRIGAATVD
jgi:FMN phosphatase YigB (HAD superfamily)